jgi:alpha-ketoglutarate-dependent taurine dioxygenase
MIGTMIQNGIHTLDLSSTIDYSKLAQAFESEPFNDRSANEIFAQLGHVGFRELAATDAPEAYAALTGVHAALDTLGAVVLKETGVNKQTDRVAQLSSIAIASAFGTPTRTDQKNQQIAWPIRYDPDTSLTPTFSQTLGEAAFHTDTQYFASPEEYFGLFCIVSDEPGKGTNKLIDGSQAVNRFEQTYGPEMRQQLERDFPFKVPSVFTKHARDDEVEVTWAPIFDSGTGEIRYRKDTIEAALKAGDIILDDAQLDALAKFDGILQETDAISYHLTPGDAVLVNNRRMLHARTSFDNPERFLYRVRMRADA